MKTIICVLTAIIASISFAQDRTTYTRAGDTSNYRVVLYSNAAIGDRAVEVVDMDSKNPDATLAIIGLTYTGLEPDGTLHLVMENNNYLVNTTDKFLVSAVTNESISFGGILGRPFEVDLSFSVGEGKKLNTTLTNADAFELSTE